MWFLLWRQRKVRYDLVHVHSVPDFLVFSAWLPKFRGAKIILDIHDLLPELYVSKFDPGKQDILYQMMLRLERWSAAFADYVIAANDIWCGKLVKPNPLPERAKLFRHFNFPDREIFFRRGRTRMMASSSWYFPAV